jgi:hypothetical protein
MLRRRHVQMSADPDPLRLPLLYSTNLLFLMLLGICGANVATLVFARTATRQSETTVRSAPDASRRRISAQLFAEPLILSAVAAAAGLGGRSIRRSVDQVADHAGRTGGVLVGRSSEARDDSLRARTRRARGRYCGHRPCAQGDRPGATNSAARSGLDGLHEIRRLWTGVIVTQVAITMVCLASVVTIAFNAIVNGTTTT